MRQALGWLGVIGFAVFAVGCIAGHFWLGAAFFGLGTIVSALMLMSGEPRQREVSPTCPMCQGRGQRSIPMATPVGPQARWGKCERCNGTGRV